jgi:hypothetical protein
MSVSMNGSDDFADLERRLVADANHLHERTVEFVDSNKLARESLTRRTRRQAGGAAALILVALTTAAVTRTWTNNPRPAAVSNLDRPPAPVVVPKGAPPQVSARTQSPTIADDAKVVKTKIDANIAATSANSPGQPLELVLTVPDGEGRRAIGRIYCLPVPKDRPQSTGQSRGPVYLLTTRRRIKFDELSIVQQDAVRRLFGIEQPVTRNVTF